MQIKKLVEFAALEIIPFVMCVHGDGSKKRLAGRPKLLHRQVGSDKLTALAFVFWSPMRLLHLSPDGYSQFATVVYHRQKAFGARLHSAQLDPAA
jgi:hypothetical protein